MTVEAAPGFGPLPSPTKPASTSADAATSTSAPRTPTWSPPLTSAPPPAHDPPGAGVLHLSNPWRATLSTQRACYPLKFLAPIPIPSQPAHLGIVYSIAYGGGLVAGDYVRVGTTIDPGCTLVLLTQGSTKLYKHRPGMRPHAHRLRYESADGFGETSREAPLTRQRMKVSVGDGGLLLLLPDSVSPFRDSRYAQAQRIELGQGASALVLDWVNSGRGERPALPTRVTARGRWKKWGDRAEGASPDGRDEKEDTGAAAAPEAGTAPNPAAVAPEQAAKGADGVADTEVWAMAYYASTNEIVTDGTVVARERMVLDNMDHDTRAQGSALSPVARRLAPYHVYATALVYGPHLVPLRTLFAQMTDRESQFQVPRPPGLLWSYSKLDEQGGVLRVAGVEVEDVRTWLREVLAVGGIKELVGESIWPRCI